MPDSRPPDDDDDDELELEPVDPEVLAHERQRANQRTEEAVSRIDVDELFRESDYSDLGVDWTSWKQFRFTTRHLLILTALLAIGLTLQQLFGGCSTIFIVSVVLLAAGWFYVIRLERRQDAERARRREEFLAAGGAGAAKAPAADQPAPAAARPRFDFKFAFSLKEIFITMTVAAVVLALIRAFGADKMAIVLGIVALLGLVVQAAGLDPPRFVVFGWWLLLVLYLVVGLIAALTDDDLAASAPTPLPRVEIRDC